PTPVTNPLSLHDALPISYKTNWAALPMPRTNGSFIAVLAADLQKHRRLVRYRIDGTDAQGKQSRWPEPQDTVPNFAYFVYDGIRSEEHTSELQSRGHIVC